MRSKIAQKMHDNVPQEEREFVKLYGNLVLKIHETLKKQGLSQNDLALKLGKKPSEISKWLNGHNLTLKTIAKLQAELETTLLEVPKTAEYKIIVKGSITQKIAQTTRVISHVDFHKATSTTKKSEPNTTRHAS